MTKGVLVAGNDSTLLSAVEVEVAKRVDYYALATIPKRFSGMGSGPYLTAMPSNATVEKARIPIDWKPGSPVSARTLVLSAGNRLGKIDEAILVCSPPSISCAVADLKPLDIEVLTNDHIKGWLFLAKELTAGFKAKGQGTLVLVFPETGVAGGKNTATADVLASSSVASFRSLANWVLAAASDESYFAQGFTGGEAGDEAGFVNFIFKQLDDTRRRANGKLHKYGRTGFFK